MPSISNNTISLDCETNGIDLYHGAKPFLVTTCDEKLENTWWEWEVDPLTREPIVIYEDLQEIQDAVDDADWIVFQNSKFDVKAMQTAFLDRLKWDWSKVHDTLLAGHLLASNQPHDLTTMVLVYLHINLQPYEDHIKQACKEARKIVETDYPDWMLAKVGALNMPSIKKDLWKNDMWLPAAIAKAEGYDRHHPWWTVCSEYANSDSAGTVQLFKKQRKLLKERGLWEIYLERLKVLPTVYQMQNRGITVNESRLDELMTTYSAESGKAGRRCLRIASKYGYDLELPKSGVNNSLREFIFDTLKLPKLQLSKKTGQPSLNKIVMEQYQLTLTDEKLDFVLNLMAKRKRDTATTAMKGYKRFWIDVPGVPGWFVLYPSLNPTGTDTLRWSSSNPNEQNISKKEGFNIRYCFGPAPGRVWYSMDAKNIELRIPAYEAGEKEMTDLFDRTEDPPYYGSYHMLIFDTLHPDKFAKHGMQCKKVYESTWYQWTKNGNFAVQYGAMLESGTADRAYHVKGAQKRIQDRFGKVADLNQKMIAFAEEHGYVETMVDKSLTKQYKSHRVPARGYPLLCSRSKFGHIVKTVPLNYHVQGTAMWWMMKAMTRCQMYLDNLNLIHAPDKQFYMIAQVHDELLFDFPKGLPNRKKVNHLRELMELGGNDIGIPTPVGCEKHETTWSEGVTV